MRVQFLRGTALGGIGNDAYPGDVRDLPEWQARQYIATGRARMATEDPQPQREAAPAAPAASAAAQAAEAAPRARNSTRKGK